MDKFKVQNGYFAGVSFFDLIVGIAATIGAIALIIYALVSESFIRDLGEILHALAKG